MTGQTTPAGGVYYGGTDGAGEERRSTLKADGAVKGVSGCHPDNVLGDSDVQGWGTLCENIVSESQLKYT